MLTSRIRSVAFLGAALLIACDSDSPSGPSSTDVTGTWQGMRSLASATPVWHCIADEILAVPNQAVDDTLVISQVGSAATMTETLSGGLFPSVFEWMGTVDQGTVEMQEVDPEPFEAMCSIDGLFRVIQPEVSSFTATVAANAMTGTFNQRWSVVFSRANNSGQSDGEFTLQYTGSWQRE